MVTVGSVEVLIKAIDRLTAPVIKMRSSLKKFIKEQQDLTKARRKQLPVIKETTKQTKKYSEQLMDLTKSARSSLMITLPLMFGFQQIGKTMKSVLDPAMDLVGVNQVYQEFLAMKYLPTALEQLDRVMELGEAWDEQSEAERKAEGDLILWTDRLVEFGNYVVQTTMFLGALGEAFPTVKIAPFGVGVELSGRQLGTLVGLIGATATGLATLSDETSRTIIDVGGFGQAITMDGTNMIIQFMDKLGILGDTTLPDLDDAINASSGNIDALGMAVDLLPDIKEIIIDALTDAGLKKIQGIKDRLEELKDKTIEVTVDFIYDFPKITIPVFERIGKLFEGLVKAPGAIAERIGKIFGLQEGGYITRPTLAMLHPGETVLPRGESPVYFSPTINISAAISTEMDIREIGRVLVDQMRSDLMRRM